MNQTSRNKLFQFLSDQLPDLFLFAFHVRKGEKAQPQVVILLNLFLEKIKPLMGLITTSKREGGNFLKKYWCLSDLSKSSRRISLKDLQNDNNNNYNKLLLVF